MLSATADKFDDHRSHSLHNKTSFMDFGHSMHRERKERNQNGRKLYLLKTYCIVSSLTEEIDEESLKLNYQLMVVG